jgi:hypothetical protein
MLLVVDAPAAELDMGKAAHVRAAVWDMELPALVPIAESNRLTDQPAPVLVARILLLMDLPACALDALQLMVLPVDALGAEHKLQYGYTPLGYGANMCTICL